MSAKITPFPKKRKTLRPRTFEDIVRKLLA